MTAYGEHHSEETKRRISESRRRQSGRQFDEPLQAQFCACGCGEYAAVDERRNRVSKYLSGHNSRVAHPMAGRKHTDEARAKIKAKRAVQAPTRSVRTPSERSHYSTWQSWRSMLWRVDDPRNASYPQYGGRGVTVCESWRSFEAFLSDMGPRPEGRTLDRIDGDGNYEPGNCRWATREEQNANRRDPWVTRRARYGPTGRRS